MVDDEVKRKLRAARESVKERVEVERKGKRKGKSEVTDEFVGGKTYRDSYLIRRVGNVYKSPLHTTLAKYEKGRYDTFELIRGLPEKIKGWVRRGKFEYTWTCCYKNVEVNNEITLNIEIQDVYRNEKDAINKGGRLNTWFDNKSEDIGDKIAADECNDWNEKYKICGKHGYVSRRGRITEGYEIEPERTCIERFAGQINYFERQMVVFSEDCKLVESQANQIIDMYNSCRRTQPDLKIPTVKELSCKVLGFYYKKIDIMPAGAKFTNTQVNEMKSLYDKGYTEKEIAKKYGTTQQNVSSYVTGRTRAKPETVCEKVMCKGE